MAQLQNFSATSSYREIFRVKFVTLFDCSIKHGELQILLTSCNKISNIQGTKCCALVRTLELFNVKA